MSSLNSFGRLPAPPDARDLQYVMRAAIPQIKSATKPPKPRTRPYNTGPVLDQGRTSSCVGYSARSFLDAAPVMSKPSVGPSALAIYHGAQTMDEWPGTAYEGSSVRGGMKFLTSTGQVSSYVWGQSVEEAINWMNGGYGTCLVGTNWYVEMSDVDKNGFMREPAPSLTTPIGGHAWHWIWYDVKKKGILMKQSWGHEFGFLKAGQPSGYAYLTVDFAKRLLFEEGEIAAPVQILIKPTRLAA